MSPGDRWITLLSNQIQNSVATFLGHSEHHYVQIDKFFLIITIFQLIVLSKKQIIVGIKNNSK